MRQVTADAERLARELFFAPNVGNIAAIEKALAECAARARASAIAECKAVAQRHVVILGIPPRLHELARTAEDIRDEIAALPLSPPEVCKHERCTNIEADSSVTLCLDCKATSADGIRWEKA